MNRREVITIVGAVAAWPMGAVGQSRTPVIGWLGSTSPQSVTPFLDGLKLEGFTAAENVVIHYRWADGVYDRLPTFIEEFVGSQVDLIAAFTTAAATAAKNVSIPTVFLVGGDPVQLGLATSMNRPGGNRTGVSLVTHALDAKRLELLREVVPSLTRIGVMLNPKSPTAETNRKDVQAATQSLGLHPIFVEVSSEDELLSSFAKLSTNGADALLVGADSLLHSLNRPIVQLAIQHRLPAAYEWREHANNGGLLSYGTNLEAVMRDMGSYAGRILKGAKTTELPVLEPSKFELVINLKTARALGISVPPTLLARADEVIE